MDSKNYLMLLWEDYLVSPVPDSLSGGSEELYEYYQDILQLNDLISALVESYLNYNEEVIQKDLVVKANFDLRDIIDDLNSFPSQNESELYYQTQYQKWATDLFNINQLLKRCLVKDVLDFSSENIYFD
jgi:hypothetical protein